MVTIKEISYKDDRLEFFVNKRNALQKKFDKLEKLIKSDEPYSSERREVLSDYGRELSFYDDIIEMLENDIASEIFVEIAKIFNRYLDDKHYSVGEILYDLAELEEKYVTK